MQIVPNYSILGFKNNRSDAFAANSRRPKATQHDAPQGSKPPVPAHPASRFKLSDWYSRRQARPEITETTTTASGPSSHVVAGRINVPDGESAISPAALGPVLRALGRSSEPVITALRPLQFSPQLFKPVIRGGKVLSSDVFVDVHGNHYHSFKAAARALSPNVSQGIVEHQAWTMGARSISVCSVLIVGDEMTSMPRGSAFVPMLGLNKGHSPRVALVRAPEDPDKLLALNCGNTGMRIGSGPLVQPGFAIDLPGGFAQPIGIDLGGHLVDVKPVPATSEVKPVSSDFRGMFKRAG